MSRRHDASVRAGPRRAVARVPRAAALLVHLLLAAGCLRARGTPDEPVVVAVDFEGMKAADEDDLRDKLATRASDRSAWGEARRLDPDAVATDRLRVVAFYKERGHYRAGVDVDVEPAGEGRVRVVFRIREGEPVRVSRVVVEGLDAAPEAQARVGKLAIAPGQAFTWARFDAARAQLQGALAGTGWATAEVTPSAAVRAGEGTAEVTYRVEAGARYRFGAITVTGATAVPEDKVSARAEAQLEPGGWYDERRLERIQARVLELGVFSGVRVSRGVPADGADALPVVVSVREAPFRTLRLGPGIGFEPTRWEVRGQASWTHRNWLGGLRRLQLDARGGYAWIPDPFSPIRKGVVGTVSGDFLQPSVFDRDQVDFTTRVELEKSLEQAYGSTSEKIRFGFPLRLSERWTLVPSYSFEIYQLRDLGGDSSAIPIQNCPSELCVLSYLEQRVSWDGRDHPLLTTRGVYLSIALQEGFPAGGYGYTYLRFMPEARWFRPLGRGTVVAVRGRFGAIVPVNENGPAPIVALFTAGGAGSMRGYGADRLSPMAFQDGDWVPTGGNGLLEGSVEVRRSFGGSLVGAVFLDAGNVSEASGSPTQYREVLDLGALQLALGIGVRYRTSVGPFRADLGVRLPNDLSSGVPFEERFPTVPGDSGHREPIAVLHVALGEAF